MLTACVLTRYDTPAVVHLPSQVRLAQRFKSRLHGLLRGKPPHRAPERGVAAANVQARRRRRRPAMQAGAEHYGLPLGERAQRAGEQASRGMPPCGSKTTHGDSCTA
jgi:hypothetical protein